MSQKFENLSAILDGELDESTDLTSLVNDDECNQKWQRYHLTRDLLRNDHTADFSFEMTAKIARAIEQEMPIVAPKPSWKETPIIAAVIPVFKQTTQLAAAACVTAVAIFSYQSYNQPEEVQPFTAAPSSFGPIGGLSPVSLQQGAESVSDQERMSQLIEQRRQLNALIQDHERQLKLKHASQQTKEKEQQDD